MSTYVVGPISTGAVTATGPITAEAALTVAGAVTTPHAAAALGATYTTTSTTAVSTGFGVSLASPGSVLGWIVHAVVANNTAGDGGQLTLYRSTAGIPAAGSAPAAGDVAVWTSGPLLSTAANQSQVAGGDYLDTGLTAGTTYYYYLAAQAVTGGTASVVADTGATTVLIRAVA
jgi:hypothetical protein